MRSCHDLPQELLVMGVLLIAVVKSVLLITVVRVSIRLIVVLIRFPPVSRRLQRRKCSRRKPLM